MYDDLIADQYRQFQNGCCEGLSECGGNTSPQAGNPNPLPLPSSAGVRTPASLVPARVEPEGKH